jgi:hypothetical protein
LGSRIFNVTDRLDDRIHQWLVRHQNRWATPARQQPTRMKRGKPR